ncbi:MAG: AsnC family transcriptional regulator [Candidatus Nitrosocaldus sp.]|nr:AsnC family transcriptional regulator [Candidatus Nitrosocaldus sp.]
MQAQELDALDREMLNIIQWEFPLVARPFLAIGERLGISEEEVMARIRRMKDEQIIREIDAIFDTRRLKYKSALIAMSVDASRIEYVAGVINGHPGVSHNYERDDANYNLWFTIAVPPYGNVKHEVERFAKLDGVRRYMILPTVKLYKIGVRLDMTGDEDAMDVKPTDNSSSSRDAKPAVNFEPDEMDKRFIRELQRDIEVVSEPFKEPARRLGVGVDEYIARAKYYESIGVMRRFAAILRHRNAGFIANGMIVWIVPEERVDEVGTLLASFPQVTHCYRRPTYPDWPYNLYSMVHARSREVCEGIAREFASHTGVSDYRILFSTREFKKERVRYFLEDE